MKKDLRFKDLKTGVIAGMLAVYLADLDKRLEGTERFSALHLLYLRSRTGTEDMTRFNLFRKLNELFEGEACHPITGETCLRDVDGFIEATDHEDDPEDGDTPLDALRALVNGLPEEYDDLHTENLIERAKLVLKNHGCPAV